MRACPTFSWFKKNNQKYKEEQCKKLSYILYVPTSISFIYDTFGVIIMLPAETEVMISPLCLVADQDVKKPTNQTNKQIFCNGKSWHKCK